jgi:hypothetical protein
VPRLVSSRGAVGGQQVHGQPRATTGPHAFGPLHPDRDPDRARASCSRRRPGSWLRGETLRRTAAHLVGGVEARCPVRQRSLSGGGLGRAALESARAFPQVDWHVDTETLSQFPSACGGARGFLMPPLLNGGTLGKRRNVRRGLESQGFVRVADAIGQAGRERLLRLLEPERLVGATRHRLGGVVGARHLLSTIPELGAELKASGVDALVSGVLEVSAFPIDAAYFDKQSAANWTVPVHQDRVLPVASDFGPKRRTTNGVAVSEPSTTALARLLAVRIHFDQTDGETGALFVLPGSHCSGVFTTEQIRAIPLTSFVPCMADVGDVLLMRPLLLHRSAFEGRGAPSRAARCLRH